MKKTQLLGDLVFFFIYFWLHWVFIAAGELSLVVASRSYSPVVVFGFLIVVASLVAEHCLGCTGFSSCGVWA